MSCQQSKGAEQGIADHSRQWAAVEGVGKGVDQQESFGSELPRLEVMMIRSWEGSQREHASVSDLRAADSERGDGGPQ